MRVQHARKIVPTNTGEFAARIAALQTRIAALQGRLVSTQQRQNDYLAGLAVRSCRSRKTRLAAYRVQARYELAAMYDRAQDTDRRASRGAAGRSAAPAWSGAQAMSTRARAALQRRASRLRCSVQAARADPPKSAPTISDLNKRTVDVKRGVAARRRRSQGDG